MSNKSLNSVTASLTHPLSLSRNEAEGLLIPLNSLSEYWKSYQNLFAVYQDQAKQIGKDLGLSVECEEGYLKKGESGSEHLAIVIHLFIKKGSSYSLEGEDLIGCSARDNFINIFEDNINEILKNIEEYIKQANNGFDPEITHIPNKKKNQILCTNELIALDTRKLITNSAHKGGIPDIVNEIGGKGTSSLPASELPQEPATKQEKPDWVEGHVESVSDANQTVHIQTHRKRIKVHFQPDQRDSLIEAQKRRRKIKAKLYEIQGKMAGAVIDSDKSLETFEEISDFKDLQEYLPFAQTD